MLTNPWTAIILNVVIAVLSALAAVNWPDVVSAQTAIVISSIVTGLNAVAHAFSGSAGPAAKTPSA